MLESKAEEDGVEDGVDRKKERVMRIVPVGVKIVIMVVVKGVVVVGGTGTGLLVVVVVVVARDGCNGVVGGGCGCRAAAEDVFIAGVPSPFVPGKGLLPGEKGRSSTCCIGIY